MEGSNEKTIDCSETLVKCFGGEASFVKKVIEDNIDRTFGIFS